MQLFEVTATTIRDGVTVDDVEFEVPGQAPAHGYLVRGTTGEADRSAIAMHGEHGDRASLLPDLIALAANGFTALSIDSPATRAAIRDRDLLTAFTSELAIARAGLGALNADPLVHPDRFAAFGRGIGAEVAGHLAATSAGCRVVVAAGALPHRSTFLRTSDHPLAAGFRLRMTPEQLAAQADGLAPFDLVDQMGGTDVTWMLQVADADDRLSAEDLRELAISIPGGIHVSHVDEWADLGRPAARRERVEFITRLC